jgi:BirA family transcriptional regulator, biotin operon repressor / biotin---[acetyl-CoA-carboxylase] ligase
METSLRIPSPWPGAPVYLRETTGSTMDDARTLAAGDCPTGTTVVAGFQRQGRGRGHGRSWLSAPWESLLATVVIRRADARFPVGQLTLRAGLAAALAVEEAAGREVRIKWPNDILWEGRKIAGILCEAGPDALLAGFGVNCLQERFPPQIAATACSILTAAGREVAPLELLPRLLARLEQSLCCTGWQEQVLARLTVADGDLQGLEVRGIGEDGALLLGGADGLVVRRDR